MGWWAHVVSVCSVVGSRRAFTVPSSLILWSKTVKTVKMSSLPLAIVLAVASSAEPPVFRFSNVHGDGMVLQAAPKQATVWGLCPPGDTVTVSLDGG